MVGPQNRAKTSPFRYLTKCLWLDWCCLPCGGFCPKQLGGWQSFLWLQKRPQAKRTSQEILGGAGAGTHHSPYRPGEHVLNPGPGGQHLPGGEEGGDVQSVWSLPRTAGHTWALTCARRHWISSPSLKFLTFTGLEGGAACSRPCAAPG